MAGQEPQTHCGRWWMDRAATDRSTGPCSAKHTHGASRHLKRSKKHANNLLLDPKNRPLLPLILFLRLRRRLLHRG